MSFPRWRTNTTWWHSRRDDQARARFLIFSLVVVELGLKDARYEGTTRWDRTHDVALWVTEIQDPGLNSLAVQLSTALASIRCTLKDGTGGPVSPQMYPAVRYVRHESDFPGETTDAEINEALRVVGEIENELKRRGVLT